MSTQPVAPDIQAPPPAPPQETAIVRRAYGSLYEIEDGLLALLDTEEFVSDEQRGEYLDAVQQQLAVAESKRDAVGYFYSHLDTMDVSIDAEIDRLKALQNRVSSARKQMDNAVRGTIMNLGMDAKGKYRKLEGKTTVLSIQKNPDSCSVTSEESIPLAYKNAVLTMDAVVWNALIEDLFPEDRKKIMDAITKQDLAVRLKDVKEALKAAPETRKGELTIELKRTPTEEELAASLDAKPVVPGAHLTSSYRVVRK